MFRWIFKKRLIAWVLAVLLSSKEIQMELLAPNVICFHTGPVEVLDQIGHNIFGIWSSIIWDSMSSQGFRFKFFREKQNTHSLRSVTLFGRILNGTFPFEDMPWPVWTKRDPMGSLNIFLCENRILPTNWYRPN